jgi:hypothetical protein
MTPHVEGTTSGCLTSWDWVSHPHGTFWDCSVVDTHCWNCGAAGFVTARQGGKPFSWINLLRVVETVRSSICRQRKVLPVFILHFTVLDVLRLANKLQRHLLEALFSLF